ncbi:beta-lactamase [Alloactinosynnema sp. L-07]|nr:beta-lactamase [Alloactinosynnema sp. L-07]
MLMAAVLIGLTACSAPLASPVPQARPMPVMPSAPGSPPAPPIDPASVVGGVRSVVKNATVSAVVYDRAIGVEPLSIKADRQFDSASLVKLLIAIDVLETKTTQEDRKRITRMLSASDDTAASHFWLRGGRTDIVARMRERIGLTGTEPPANPDRWGSVRTTANDIVRVYQHVLGKLPGDDNALILTALESAPRNAADGFDQHFGIPDALRVPWAVKQGWGNNKQAKVVHSTGLAGPEFRYIVVLLTEHPLRTPTATAAKAVTAGASALTVLFPAGKPRR